MKEEIRWNGWVDRSEWRENDRFKASENHFFPFRVSITGRPRGGDLFYEEEFIWGLGFPKLVPWLEDEWAVMIFEIEDGEAGKIVYFWRRGGLFSCFIDSVVFREANVSRNPDEGNLGADWVKGMKS